LVATELKTGQVNLTKSIRRQINKDAYLLETQAVAEVKWVISPGRTGKHGVSNPVVQLFHEHGIQMEFGK
jgi:hypothetical protein